MIPTIEQVGDAVVTLVASGRWRSNCYIVAPTDSTEVIIIDPAVEIEVVLSALDGRLPVRILLTHGHYDHVGVAEELSVRFDLPCEVHERDQALLGHAGLYAISFEQRRCTPPTFIRTFGDEALFDVGGLRLRALHCPGHTPGSVGFAAQGVLFTGDTLFRGAIGRVDLPGGNPRELALSIDRLLADVEPATRLFPGHGRPWTAAEASEWWAGRSRGPG